jgi:probable phosphomutase (TIGR03848 family)
MKEEGELMSVIILLRHAHSAANDAGLLTGRLPGISLSKKGFAQANDLVERIGRVGIDRLHISPIERCQLTIDPWLRSKYSSTLESFSVNDNFNEIDFGDWSGRKLTSLRREKLWKSIQDTPSQVTFPNGESFKAAQRRAFNGLEEIAHTRGSKVDLILSHSDTIKLIVTKFLGMKLDSFQQIQINPASFTILNYSKNGSTLKELNNMGNLKDLL